MALLAISDPRTGVPRLGLLRLRPDPIHGSPLRGPLIDRSPARQTRFYPLPDARVKG